MKQSITLFVTLLAATGALAIADQPGGHSFTCSLSPVVYGVPDGYTPASGRASWWYANDDRTLWAGHAGTLRAGDPGNKMPWIRPKGTQLTVTARRLGADSSPARVDVPCCYGALFQISGAFFPRTGCWEVSAQAGESTLTFVTFVQPAIRPDDDAA